MNLLIFLIFTAIKNKMKAYRILFLFCILLCFSKTFAQRVRLTSSLGASAYWGDLIQNRPVLKEVSPAFSIGATYDLQDQIRARLNISFLSVSGDDKYNSRADLRARNLSFKTNIFEVSAMGEYDFVMRDERMIIPYVFGGPGIFHFNPYTYYKGNKVYLQPLATEGEGWYQNRPTYSLTQFNFSLGFGLRWEYSESLSIGAEFCYRKLFTDYLDDVSLDDGYIDPAALAAHGNALTTALNYRGGELPGGKAVSLTLPRGNPGSADVYYSFQLTVSYKLENLFIGKEYGSPYGRIRTAKSRY